MTQQKLTNGEGDGIKLVTRTTCDVGGIDNEWNTSNMDVGSEVEEAIKEVQEDHSKEITIDSDSLWMFSVHWNENTDSVWVARFAYQGGMEVITSD